ncbi:MAG TPA: hypothetical protein ENF70_07820 [Deltaproteobacteria bacterium]|nr:hypothetical protein [Deltaproteobacteria bacterium]
MENYDLSKKASPWLTVVYIIIGAAVSLTVTVLTQLYLIPSREIKLHMYQQKEHRVTRLYQPLLVSTGYGNFSMTAPGVFFKVNKIMESYGYLADQEVVEKYIEFLKLVRFVNYNDLREGNFIQKPASENLIIELIRQGVTPLEWTASSLEKALKVEKEFQNVVRKHYKEAVEDLKNS